MTYNAQELPRYRQHVSLSRIWLSHQIWTTALVVDAGEIHLQFQQHPLMPAGEDPTLGYLLKKKKKKKWGGATGRNFFFFFYYPPPKLKYIVIGTPSP